MATPPWKMIVIPVLIGISAFALGIAADRIIHRKPKTPPSTNADVQDAKRANPNPNDKSYHDELRPEQPQSMASRLNAYLQKKKSPLQGIGDPLVSDANAYGVDPRLLVAIAG